MKTDSLYYKIFAAAPRIFFELIDRPVSSEHRFDSVEVKQTAFRIDGVFLPQPTADDPTVYFVEVQFQPNDALYQRLFAEIALFLKHHPATQNWRAVVLFARRSFEPSESPAYVPFLDLPNVSRIYLDEPPAFEDEPFAWGLMRLIVGDRDRASDLAKQLIRRTSDHPGERAALIELVETTLVYKFPELGLEEIAKMLGIATEASQTRVFQEGRAEGRSEGRAEGRVEGEQILVLRQLERKVGTLSPELATRIASLSTTSLEALGEALLDFETAEDLAGWLQSNP
ncbi:MAG: Rpn family recombination-promoting nuclease/putative transposase [Cyanobacteria bacterium J06648_11]